MVIVINTTLRIRIGYVERKMERCKIGRQFAKRRFLRGVEWCDVDGEQESEKEENKYCVTVIMRPEDMTMSARENTTSGTYLIKHSQSTRLFLHA